MQYTMLDPVVLTMGEDDEGEVSQAQPTIAPDIATVCSVRWRGQRTERVTRILLAKIVANLSLLGITRWEQFDKHTGRLLIDSLVADGWGPATVTRGMKHLRTATRWLVEQGFIESAPPFTIPSQVEPPKWWLPPELLIKLRQMLDDIPDMEGIAEFIVWQCHTGLRVEESLRVKAHMFIRSVAPEAGREHWLYDLTVPGTKTTGSAKTIALDTEASEMAARFLARVEQYRLHPDTPLFTFSYPVLMRRWRRVRALLGQDDPTCTLKALRRTCARYRIEEGMPGPVLQSYLRHKRWSTTEGYLNLVGDYSTQTQRKWLK